MRAEDGALEYYAYPTPGRTNAQAVSDPAALVAYPADGVYISEVCAGGPDGDWIELHNPGERPVRLAGYILTDKPDTFDPACVLPSAEGTILPYYGAKGGWHRIYTGQVVEAYAR